MSDGIFGVAESFAGREGERAARMGPGQAAGLISDLVSVGAEFDKLMKFSGALANATTADFQKMRAKAKELGATTAFTASQAAEGFVLMSQAGFSAKESIGSVQDALHMAGAGAISLDKASLILINTMRRFKSETPTDAANILTRAFSGSTQGLNQLGYAMKQFAPVAAATGRSLKEVAGFTMLYANAGFPAESGGVAMRNVFANLQKPTKNLERALSFLNLKMEDLDFSTHSIIDVWNKLRPLMQRTDLVWNLFGKKSAPAFIAAMNQGRGALEMLTAKLDEGHTAASLYASQMDTTAGQIMILKSAWEAVQIAVFDGIEKVFKKRLMLMSGVVQTLSIAFDRLKPAINVIMSVLGEVFDRIAGWGQAVAGGFGRAIMDLGRMTSDAQKDITNTVLHMTLAAGILKMEFLDFFDGFIDGFNSAWSIAKTTMGATYIVITKVLDPALQLIGFFKEGDSAAYRFGKAVGFLTATLASFVALKVALFFPLMFGQSMVNGVKGVRKFVKWLPKASKALKLFAFTQLPAAITAVKAFTIALLTNPITWVIAGVVALGAALYGIIYHWDAISEAAMRMLQTVRGVFRDAGDWVKSFVASIEARFPVVGSLIRSTLRIVRSIFSMTWSYMRMRVLKFVDFTVGSFRQMRANLSKFPETVTRKWKETFDLFFGYFEGRFPKATKFVVRTFRTMMKQWKDIGSTTLDFLKKGYGLWFDYLLGKIEWVSDKVKGIADWFDDAAARMDRKADAAGKRMQETVDGPATTEISKPMDVSYIGSRVMPMFQPGPVMNAVAPGAGVVQPAPSTPSFNFEEGSVVIDAKGRNGDEISREFIMSLQDAADDELRRGK